jgi:hypothetical protein
MNDGGTHLTKIVLALAALLAPAAVLGQDHSSCPMRSKAAEHRAAVDHRHDAATGVSHADSVHHFLLTPDGGTIRLEATPDAPAEDREQIRIHLRHVARAFAAGNFDLPMLIHAQVPSGVAVMKKRKARIQYAFSETDRGGEVRITTRDTAARAAVHDFLRFQIDDHGTGDPRE